MISSEPRYRHEYKYLINSSQATILQNRIRPIMKSDPHAGPSGEYNIRSIYFDDYDNGCLWDNLSGTEPREKIRIRIYNRTPVPIFLECKKKEHGKTLKQASLITLQQFNSLVAASPFSPCSITGSNPLFDKVCLEKRTHLLHPTVIVDYDRIPYVYPLGNVRITFDYHLCSSDAFTHFFDSCLQTRPLMPIGTVLLEVKYDEYIPSFIQELLQLKQLQQTAHSKYAICRQNSLQGE